jgi:hypothetical protein
MNYRISRLCFSLCLLTLPGYVLADVETMNRILKQTPELAVFDICHGGGCSRISATQIDDNEWAQVKALCPSVGEDAEAERRCIADMIGEIEKIVGAKTGTDEDRGGTFGNSAYSGQMDCNDEAINTTTYLKLMQQHGLIQFHEIHDIRRRGFFLNRWPHTTAVITEIQSGQRYAVDAWFYDNGMPPAITLFETWKSGWKPEDSQAH